MAKIMQRSQEHTKENSRTPHQPPGGAQTIGRVDLCQFSRLKSRIGASRVGEGASRILLKIVYAHFERDGSSLDILWTKAAKGCPQEISSSMCPRPQIGFSVSGTAKNTFFFLDVFEAPEQMRRTYGRTYVSQVCTTKSRRSRIGFCVFLQLYVHLALGHEQE